jgi:hypothetical protein
MHVHNIWFLFSSCSPSTFPTILIYPPTPPPPPYLQLPFSFLQVICYYIATTKIVGTIELLQVKFKNAMDNLFGSNFSSYDMMNKALVKKINILKLQPRIYFYYVYKMFVIFLFCLCTKCVQRSLAITLGIWSCWISSILQILISNIFNTTTIKRQILNKKLSQRKLFYHGCIVIDVHLWIASRSRSFHHGLIPWWGESMVKYIEKVDEKIQV